MQLRRMVRMLLGPSALAVALALGPWEESVATGKRVRATVTCQPTDEDLAYRCTIKVADGESGAPVTGAVLVMSANMPSMPLAHPMKPVHAVPGEAPGTYQATLKLDMAGRWALTIKVTGPVVDQIVHVEEFTHGREAQPHAGPGHGGTPEKGH